MSNKISINRFIAATLGLGVALAACTAGFSTASAQTLPTTNQQTKTQQITPAPVLNPVINLPVAPALEAQRAAFRKEISQADRPIFFLLTNSAGGQNQGIEKVARDIAQRYPGVKFVRLDGDNFGITSDRLPAIATWLPRGRKAIFVRYSAQSIDGGEDVLIEERVKALIEIASLRYSVETLEIVIEAKEIEIEDYFDPFGGNANGRELLEQQLKNLNKTRIEAALTYIDKLEAERELSDVQ